MHVYAIHDENQTDGGSPDGTSPLPPVSFRPFIPAPATASPPDAVNTTKTYDVNDTTYVQTGTYNYAGTAHDIADVGFLLQDDPLVQGTPSLINLGAISETTNETRGFLTGIGIGGSNVYTGLIWNAPGASFTLAAPRLTGAGGGGDAFWVYSDSFTPTITNDGSVSVTCNDVAYGVYISDSTNIFTNTGTFHVYGKTGGAGYYNLSGGHFNNYGDFEVSGGGGAASIGVQMYGAISFLNTGTMSVTDSTGATEAVLFEPASSTVQLLSNFGDIHADWAFYEDDFISPLTFSAVSINNSGTIEGNIFLAPADEVNGAAILSSISAASPAISPSARVTTGSSGRPARSTAISTAERGTTRFAPARAIPRSRAATATTYSTAAREPIRWTAVPDRIPRATPPSRARCG